MTTTLEQKEAYNKMIEINDKFKIDPNNHKHTKLLTNAECGYSE